MINHEYVSKARKHWAKWLPEKTAALKASGDLEAALQIAANNCRDRVDELRAQGYQQHEAEEVALPEFILLKPEPAANLAPWERKELAAKEAEYRRLMKG